jgi:hypothetical protein
VLRTLRRHGGNVGDYCTSLPDNMTA